MTTIACVLRSGGPYDARWVRALLRQVYAWAPRPTRFHCVTDVVGWSDELRDEDFQEDNPHWTTWPIRPWPGWWAKLNLFAPGVFAPGERVLYLDLDTLVVGDLGPLLSYRGSFAMLRDWFPPHLTSSGVMAFTPGAHTDALWDAWIEDPEHHMRTYRGDADFIREHVEHEDLMEIYPGRIETYKEVVLGGGLRVRKTPPEGASLICGHGSPRFDDPAAGWAHDAWKRWAT